MRLVSLEDHRLTKEQGAVLNRGLEGIERFNPVPLGWRCRKYWVAFDVESPVGLLGVGYDSAILGEVSANFFNTDPRNIITLDRFIGEQLNVYNALVARVFAWNTRMKKVVERGGFRLVGSDGDIDKYMLVREDYRGGRWH